jgi:hypothetical protein
MIMTMKSRGQQAAMFLAGIAANETLGHWWLGTLGRDMLPMKFGQFTVTVVLGGLVWFAWVRKERIPAL